MPFCLMRLGISSTERMIRQIAGWNEEETWNVPGVLLAEEQALVYDIKAAKNRSLKAAAGLSSAREKPKRWKRQKIKNAEEMK